METKCFFFKDLMDMIFTHINIIKIPSLFCKKRQRGAFFSKYRYLQPFYFRWFKSWQEMLNNGVQQAFQDFADTYSHSLNVPSEMTIHKNMFITYKVIAVS